MTFQNRATEPQTSHSPDADILRLRQAGRQIAESIQVKPPDKAACSALARDSKNAFREIDHAFHHNTFEGQDSRWLIENYRLLRTAGKQTSELAKSFRECRTAVTGSSGSAGSPGLTPLPFVVSRAYAGAAFDFVSEDGLTAFLNGLQEVLPLEMSELWAIKPALQLMLLERVSAALKDHSISLAVLITSLRTLGEFEWKDVFESVSVVSKILAKDPDGSYSRMDYFSREQYREVIGKLAKNSELSEREIASKAIRLAEEASSPRQRHVGYWLLDGGYAALRKAIGYQVPPGQRVADLVLGWPQTYYLIGVEALTLILVFTLLEGPGSDAPTLLGLCLLILPVTQAAVDWMNNMTSFLVRPRAIPKLDFTDGIPSEFATLVAVPTLLLNEKQVRQLVTDLEIRFLANRDPNLYFALVTDSPDSDYQQDDRDVLIDVCVSLINALNDRYGHSGAMPFYLFHRHRVYNANEGRWMGWERKRGKLLDLNQLMRGGMDAFPVKVGDLSVLPRIKYVLTLDSDTQLPRDAAHKLVGAIAHPLHRAVVDPSTKMVVAGYGILQPRIGLSIQSAAASRLASIYSGQTGFDIYTRAVSDVYQDLFAEGIFTGKGIYDVDAVRDTVEHRFPENALLSHDLIEGVYARAALCSDVELIDDYPSHFSAYSRRKHRWVRGDWQIMLWLRPRVPNFEGKIISNPISLISRWKILDNLRRSLIEPATLALLVAGWFWLKHEAAYWTCVSLALLLTPVYANLFFSILRAPLTSPLLAAWAKDTAGAFVKGHLFAFLQVAFLLHQALLSIDAIVRSLMRVSFTRKRMLEWETAAEAENQQRRKATVDIYLAWSPLLALAIGGLIWFFRRDALPVAAPILTLWVFAPLLSAFLNRAPRTALGKLPEKDARFLREASVRTWRYFLEWSSPATNWLIPDNVREDGRAAERLSPTNLGLLLNARIAAVHFGYLTLPEFVEQTKETLQRVHMLSKHRGHIFNWYSNEDLHALAPRFVSTVDNGNLAACLWTLKQAALSFAEDAPSSEWLRAGMEDVSAEAMQASGQDAEFWNRERAERARRMQRWQDTGLTPELVSQLKEIAETCDELVSAMDFNFLWHRRKKVMSVGCDVDTELIESSSYDLLASESRIASFVAIAKSDVSQEAWFHLGRKHTLYAGQRVLVSWTGTMFEYLMPALWMKHYRSTIMQDSMQAIVRVQKRFARRKRILWGISESGCAAGPNGEYGYHAFGIPDVAMRSSEGDSRVVSPYSAFLALLVDPRAALKNLRTMAKRGWLGRYGFYEAVDYRHGQAEVIRSWMAHHQGMSLLAACNVLFDNPIQEYFHAEPQVLATELLLHERVPSGITIDQEDPLTAPVAVEAAA